MLISNQTVYRTIRCEKCPKNKEYLSSVVTMLNFFICYFSDFESENKKHDLLPWFRMAESTHPALPRSYSTHLMHFKITLSHPSAADCWVRTLLCRSTSLSFRITCSGMISSSVSHFGFLPATHLRWVPQSQPIAECILPVSALSAGVKSVAGGGAGCRFFKQTIPHSWLVTHLLTFASEKHQLPSL